jgi:hypothetical protein
MEAAEGRGGAMKRVDALHGEATRRSRTSASNQTLGRTHPGFLPASNWFEPSVYLKKMTLGFVH